MSDPMVLLGIDTCGPSGTVALARVSAGRLEILGQTDLAARSYSATLVAAVGELLQRHGVALKGIGAIVVVHGPGSFTGVRVGLSAAKGLAEAAGIAVVAVSRLEVLAHKAETAWAALDAHRHEVFLRAARPEAELHELLAGAEELAAIGLPPAPVAICDEGAAALLSSAWPGLTLVQVHAPTAADALALALPRALAGERRDLVLLDGHYLRRSDAEIFGAPAAVGPRGA